MRPASMEIRWNCVLYIHGPRSPISSTFFYPKIPCPFVGRLIGPHCSFILNTTFVSYQLADHLPGCLVFPPFSGSLFSSLFFPFSQARLRDLLVCAGTSRVATVRLSVRVNGACLVKRWAKTPGGLCPHHHLIRPRVRRNPTKQHHPHPPLLLPNHHRHRRLRLPLPLQRRQVPIRRQVTSTSICPRTTLFVHSTALRL